MKATLMPVWMALAGHTSTWSRRYVMTISMAAHSPMHRKIWGSDTWKLRTVSPRIVRVMMVADSFNRGSFRLGKITGMLRPRMRRWRPVGAGGATTGTGGAVVISVAPG